MLKLRLEKPNYWDLKKHQPPIQGDFLCLWSTREKYMYLKAVSLIIAVKRGHNIIR